MSVFEHAAPSAALWRVDDERNVDIVTDAEFDRGGVDTCVVLRLTLSAVTLQGAEVAFGVRETDRRRVVAPRPDVERVLFTPVPTTVLASQMYTSWVP
ncbi:MULTISPECIES: hypothetical protein [Halolamina]|uniref:hypothetical protein n=1 Tax=Halolamina TaxID=1075397 RepID=UPI00094249A7|nr:MULTISPECIES: hypothetical protein [Halolamina]NHX34983.1 hypothetical protein [Halolamina sp. R1-12]